MTIRAPKPAKRCDKLGYQIVLVIYEKEKPEGLVVQFDGQTPLNIASELAAAGVNILGTSPDTIELAEDRDRFRKMMDQMGIPMPESGMARGFAEARQVADRIGYPLMVRPSFVLGGRGMEVIHDESKAQQAAQPPLPLAGTVFISVADKDKPAIAAVARRFQEMGFRINATNGTQAFLVGQGVKCEHSYKVHEMHRPNIDDEIKSREIDLVINTPIDKTSNRDDAYVRDNRFRMIARISTSHLDGESEKWLLFTASSCLRFLCALLCSSEVLFRGWPLPPAPPRYRNFDSFYA